MEKTYVLDGGGSDSAMMAAMMNGGGMGGFNNPFWALVLLAFLRNGFGWSGNEGSVNGGFVASQLGQAIAGNANAINNLSTHLDCTVSQIQCAVNGVQQAIANLSSQTGMGQMQIVNAINAGDAGLMNQMQTCCCDVKQLVTNLNYEGRLADQQQTVFLGGKIDSQTASVLAKLDAIEDARKDREISSLTAALTAANSRAERAAELAPIYKQLNDIACKQPATVTVPYSPVTPVPSCVAWNAALYGGLGYGYGGGQFG